MLYLSTCSVFNFFRQTKPSLLLTSTNGGTTTDGRKQVSRQVLLNSANFHRRPYVTSADNPELVEKEFAAIA